MTPEQIAQYVGRPYQLGGEGPDVYDCRGLVRNIMRRHFDVALPELPIIGAGDLLASRVAAGEWQTMPEAQHGDAVIMRAGADPHIGVWLVADRPGVLHAWAMAGQVVWTPADRLRFAGFSRLTFVRCAPARG